MYCAAKIGRALRASDPKFVRSDAGVCRRATMHVRCTPWRASAEAPRTLQMCTEWRKERRKLVVGWDAGNLSGWSDTWLLVTRSSGAASFM
jgi:hypothetical protein